MAVSLDTPDTPLGASDPGFNVHSPHKQAVGSRLARSGLWQAYNVPLRELGGTIGPLASHVEHCEGGYLVHIKNIGTDIE